MQAPRPRPKPDSQKKEKSEAGLLPYFLALFLFGSAALFWYGFQDEHEGRQHAEENLPLEFSSQSDPQEMVNRHLKDTQNKIEKQQMGARYENIKTAPRIGESDFKPAEPQTKLDFETDPDPRLSEIPSAMGREPRSREETSIEPHLQVQNQLYQEQKWNEYDKAYRAAYAAQFVENARRDGWDIQLDSEYRVMSVKPIKKQKRQELFPAPSRNTSSVPQ